MSPEYQSVLNCVNCGYDLRGLTAQHACPECGLSVARSFHGGQRISGYAIASLVLGILSIALGVLGILTAPLALYYARKAQREVRAGKASPGSNGFAMAGKILGLCWIGLALLGVGLIVLAITIG